MGLATMSSPSHPRHVLRGLLRILKTPSLPKELIAKAEAAGVVSPDSKNNAARRFVLAQYRQHQSCPDPHLVATYRQLAFNAWQLRREIAERERLYALDTGAEQILTPKEMSRRAAARAGLQLPKLDDDIVNS